MKEIKCKFVNPLDNLDYKKLNGIDPEKTGAIIIDGERREYCTRNQIVEIIKQASRKGYLLSGKKIVTDNSIEYTYIIDVDEGIKGKLKVEIPTYILITDPDSNRYKKVFDYYEGKGKQIRKKRGLAIALLTGIGIAGTLGFGYVVISGIEKESEARAKKSKESHEQYQKYEDFEREKEEYERQLKEEEMAMYTTDPTEYKLPSGFIEVSTKTLK